jgi:hypothetical protein
MSTGKQREWAQKTGDRLLTMRLASVFDLAEAAGCEKDFADALGKLTILMWERHVRYGKNGEQK